MNRYPLEKTLKDGTKVLFREAGRDDDLKLLQFYRSLPVEDRQYLRTDLTIMENVRRRLDPGPSENIWRLVAECDGRICADGTLIAPVSGWMRHTCEIRSIVQPGMRGRNLGSYLLWELFEKTLNEQYRILYTEVAPEQARSVKTLEDLGFQMVLRRRDHIKDTSGRMHDLCIYAKDVKRIDRKSVV